MQIRKILLELDPRKQNRPAVERTSELAGKTGAAVDVLVCEQLQGLSDTTSADRAVIDVSRQSYLSDIEDWARAQVRHMLDAGIDVDVHAIWEKPRYDVVLQQAEQSNADLIVRMVGEHGRLKRMFLGSTDWDLIRHARQPLWLVQDGKRSKDGCNFLVAVDPTHPNDQHMQLDRQLLDFASQLAQALAGSVHVYHAHQLTPVISPAPVGATLAPPVPRVDPEFLERNRALHRSKLDELLAEYDIDDDKAHLVEGDAAYAIGEVIDSNDIDVVVAGAISRSWLERLLIGSTAESLLHAVDCDLVVVKAEQSNDD